MAQNSGDSSPPSNFSWVEPGVLAGSGCPATVDHYKYLSEVGIRHIITLKEEYPPGSAENSEKFKLRRTLINIVDFHPPTLNQIKEFIELIEEAKKTSQPVVVHCALGQGRTGTMLACYLVKHKKLLAEDALPMIRKMRPRSVETIEQEKAITNYYLYLNQENG